MRPGVICNICNYQCIFSSRLSVFTEISKYIIGYKSLNTKKWINKFNSALYKNKSHNSVKDSMVMNEQNKSILKLKAVSMSLKIYTQNLFV